MNNPEENYNESTDDQWYRYLDEEQEYETVSLSDRAKAIRSGALEENNNELTPAFGWLSMDIALKELTIKDHLHTIEHLKECIKILEKR